MSEPRQVALLLIGDELLSGKIDDRNGPAAIRTLRGVGADVREVRIIGDDPVDITAAVAELSGRYDVLLTSGGVGPTHDDLTIAAVASAFGLALTEDATLLAHIRTVFGHDDEEFRVWSRMATVPYGCELVTDGGLVWPVYKVRNVYLLPGVPQIFQQQMEALCARFACVPVGMRVIYLTVGEGRVAETLVEAMQRHPEVRLGSYPVLGNPDYRTRVTVESRSEEALVAATEWLAECFGTLVFSVEEDVVLRD